MWFNQYINPIALGNIAWKYYIVYTVWLAVELTVVYFFYIETRNTPLEGESTDARMPREDRLTLCLEIARHFDGESAVIGGEAATEKGRQLADAIGLEDTPRSDSVNDNKDASQVAHKEVAA